MDRQSTHAGGCEVKLALRKTLFNFGALRDLRVLDYTSETDGELHFLDVPDDICKAQLKR